MTISDLIENYNFHDSLLENFSYDDSANILSFEIDFCYWAQENFKDGEDENGIVILQFYGISSFCIDDYVVESDSILSFKQIDSGKIEIATESGNGDIHIFSFYALSATLSKMNDSRQ